MGTAELEDTSGGWGRAATGLAAWWAGKTFLCLESKICCESVGGFSSIEDGFPYSIAVVLLADFIGLPGPGLNLEPGFPWEGFTHAFLFSSICREKRRCAPWMVLEGTNCFPSHPGEFLRGPGVLEIECVPGNYGRCSFQRSHFPP